MKNLNLYIENMDPETGGIQNTAYNFVEEFAKIREVKAYSTILPDKYKNMNIEEVESISRLKEFFWLFRNSNHNSVNLVMTCWEGIPAYFVYRLKKTPYIVLAHGEDVYNISSHGKNIKMNILNWLNRKILKNAKVVCCNSKYTYNLLDGIGDEKKVVIHPPCKLEKDFAKTKCEYDRNVIFSIGRLVERKGFQFVIQAMPMILKKYPNIKYYIAGDGPYKKKLVDLVEKYNLHNNVFFLGRVSDEEKVFYLKKCCMLIMPSYDMIEEKTVEGFGIVFVEANQYGKYVIGSRSGGIEDAIINEETGILLDSLEAYCIADKIIGVLSNLKYIYNESLVRKRKEWAEEHSVKNIVAQYDELIKRIK